jgi:hypothetical protein
MQPFQSLHHFNITIMERSMRHSVAHKKKQETSGVQQAYLQKRLCFAHELYSPLSLKKCSVAAAAEAVAPWAWALSFPG